MSTSSAQEIPDTAAMWRFVNVHFLPYTRRQLFIFMLVLWNSQAFALTPSNPLGIKYFQETLYAFLLIFSMLYLLSQILNSGAVKKLDLLVFLLVIFGFLYSPLAAWVRFKQPVWYGLVEERRILAFLIYFPIVWALRNRVVTVHKLFNWVYFAAFLCALLSVGIVTGLIHPLQEIELSYGGLREDRYCIGLWYIAIAAMLDFFRVSLRGRFFPLATFLFFLWVLIVIGQTRQIIISLMIALLIMRASFFLKVLFVPALALLLVGISWIPQLAALVDKYTALFAQLTTTEYLTESARALTILTILQEFFKGSWLGSGALSDLWHGGFLKVYSPNFYLSDVGVFASLYRFGVLAIPLYLLYLAKQLRIVRAMSAHPYYRLVLAVWLQLLVLLPVGAVIEHKGSIAGLLLAISVGCLHELAPASRTQ